MLIEQVLRSAPVAQESIEAAIIRQDKRKEEPFGSLIPHWQGLVERIRTYYATLKEQMFIYQGAVPNG